MLSTDKQTDRQTNQLYQKHNLLCQGGNYPFPMQLPKSFICKVILTLQAQVMKEVWLRAQGCYLPVS